MKGGPDNTSRPRHSGARPPDTAPGHQLVLKRHHQDHGHSHADHSGHHSYNSLRGVFWMVSSFMLVEIFCGWLFNSMALMSDGFHMLSDSFALGMAFFAARMSDRKPSLEKTFGYKRFSILAAFSNGWLLLIVSVLILFHGGQRLLRPEPIDALPMLGVAAIGLGINVIAFFWLHGGSHEKSLNVKGALWHVLGDLLASLAAVLAAVGILWRGWLWLDPALSLGIAGIIAFGGIRLMRKSGHILVEGIPEPHDLDHIRRCIMSVEPVSGVHDLHAWTMDGQDLYISAHMDLDPDHPRAPGVVSRVDKALRHECRATHVTLQVDCLSDGRCYNQCSPTKPSRAAPSS